MMIFFSEAEGIPADSIISPHAHLHGPCEAQCCPGPTKCPFRVLGARGTESSRCDSRVFWLEHGLSPNYLLDSRWK